MKPQRIQRSRAAGWVCPANTRYVGRPSKFGNPFTGLHAVQFFRRWLNGQLSITEFAWRCEDTTAKGADDFDRREEILSLLPTLRGKNLACWCAPNLECHADVLLELANEVKK